MVKPTVRPFEIGPHPSRLDKLMSASVFVEFADLATALNAGANLGSGFPNWEPPEFILDAAKTALDTPQMNTYSQPRGEASMTKAVAEIYGPKFGRTLHPTREVMSTVGSAQGIALAFQTLVQEGDEVILFEPFFDLHRSSALLSHATIVPIPFRCRAKDGSGKAKTTDDFYIDPDELRAKMNDRTRMIIVNSPHNPTGKVFSREELESIAEVVSKFPRCAVVSDEVYEHLTYDGNTHVPFATIGNMWERTITLYSAAKTFAVTGWKIGWAIGPESLIRVMTIAQQWGVVSVCRPLQDAVGAALRQAELPYGGYKTYYEYIRNLHYMKRQKILKALKDAGLNAVVPQGAYYVLVDTSSVADFRNEFPAREDQLSNEGKVNYDGTTRNARDYNFSRWLAFERGVITIPTGAFFVEEHKHLAEGYVRVAYCKTDDQLDRAAECLRAHKAQQRTLSPNRSGLLLGVAPTPLTIPNSTATPNGNTDEDNGTMAISPVSV